MSTTSIMCKNFVQNAWKKDLCSNCFKAREEHDILAINGIKSRYQNQSLPPNNQDTNYQPRSIMKTVDIHAKKIHAKTTPSSTVKRNNNTSTNNNPRVNFPKDVSEVIGYGGEEWTSDTEEFELSEESPEDDVHLAPEDDTERELIRLTKSNTDFNMCNANLLAESQHSVTETRRVFASLMLGKTQTDSDGKKQTLLVSVTPFGQDSSPRPQPQKKLTHTPIAKNKESLTENKTPVILTSYSKSEVDSPKLLSNNKNNKDEKSLLEEINETLEKNKKNNETKLKTESDKNKENVLPAEYIKTKAECVFINGTNNNSEPSRQKNGLTRHTVLLKQEKPSIYQTNNKITKDLKNTTNQQQIELNNKSTPVSKDEVIEATSPLLVKTEIRFIPNEILSLKEKEEETETKIRFEETAEKILGLPPISPTKFSSSDVFDVEANSRELAGEPDGRADDSPDIINEPPALPLTPPPTIVGSIDSRPSFLHSPTKRNQTQDKPKVPVKPNKILQKTLIPPSATPLASAPSLINSLSSSSDNIDNNSSDNISTEDLLSGENTYESLKSPLTKQDSGGSDLNRKRRAPKPPPASSPEEGSPGGTTMYQRNSITNSNHDSPVVREKEKRERASSCSPKFRNGINSNPAGGESTPNLSLIPEPAPRRSLSLSQDSLAITSPVNNVVERPDEKKKHRGRFSLKKFLRMGTSSSNSNKEVEKTYTTHLTSTISMPQPRPRLVIVHPTDLINGAEILKSDDTLSTSNESTSNGSSSSERDTPSPPRPCKPPPPPRNNTQEWKIMHKLQPLPPKNDELLRQQKIWNNNYIKKPSPKENIYANVGEVRAVLTPSKPVRTASMREREAAHLEATQNRRNKENTYNGHDHLHHHQVELRKDLSPSSSPTENVYDLINGQRSSSPECDSSLGKGSPPTNNKNLCNGLRNGVNNSTPRRSADGGTNGFLDSSSEYLNGKYNHLTNGYVRTTSLPYCGSETESEIYSPYSFYGSEADVGDDESEWTNTGTRTYRLRSRKGRSIVHKNLEDNYGAVIVANHEALAQVLEHMHQTTIIQPALRGLKTAPNLRWTDFSIVDTPNNQINGGGNNGGNGLNGCITTTTRHIGRRCFHTALWGAHHVTLALTLEQGSMLQTNTILSLAPFTLVPITEFSDLVPINYLPNHNNITSINNNNNEDTKIVQATIAVLPWMQVDTIQSMGGLLRSKLALSLASSTGSSNTPSNNENTNNIEQSSSRTSSIMNGIIINNNAAEELHCREACFVLLQLINGLKCLQAQGIEELPLSLSSFALCRELERDTHPRLCVLQGLSEEISRADIGDNNSGDRLGSLCECALKAVNELLPKSSLTSLLEDLLRRERAISLTQVKSVLEFTLWGPSDVTLTTPIKDRELALQRWLDLERATVLHGLVRTRVQLTVFEECHLLFLVRSTAKMMCEASLLLDTIVKTS